MKQNKHQQQQFWVGCFLSWLLGVLKMFPVILATDAVTSKELFIVIYERIKHII